METTIAELGVTTRVPEDARLVTATVLAYNADAATLEYFVQGHRRTGVMPITEQLPGRTWQVGDQMIAVVCDDGDHPILSSARPEVAAAVLAGYCPELVQGTVVVKGCARHAGLRTKIAVAATVAGVDPVAACVGRQYNRIAAVRRDLGGEQVDVIAWNPDRSVYLRNALQPAEATSVTVDEEASRAVVTTPAHQMSAAVGVGGANSALAGQLVGLRVRVEADQ